MSARPDWQASRELRSAILQPQNPVDESQAFLRLSPWGGTRAANESGERSCASSPKLTQQGQVCLLGSNRLGKGELLPSLPIDTVRCCKVCWSNDKGHLGLRLVSQSTGLASAMQKRC